MLLWAARQRLKRDAECLFAISCDGAEKSNDENAIREFSLIIQLFKCDHILASDQGHRGRHLASRRPALIDQEQD